MAASQPDELGGDEDTQLLVASQHDPRAFAGLYSRNADRVVAYFYRRILCAHTSGELTAETFAQAYESRHRFVPLRSGSGVAWLFGIAANLHKEFVRRAVIGDGARKRLAIVTPQLVEEDLERIESLVDLSAFREALQEALAELSPRLREAVILRAALDVPYPEVAGELGCTIATARVRVSRGLHFLLERLEAR